MPVFMSGKEKRDSFDYRRHFIKHHPGIFGRYYICSLCFTPLTEKEMEVDHIFPNSKWFSPNKTFNCVSTCMKCNRSKSDSMGWVTVRGVVMKVFEEIYIFIHRIIVFIFDLFIKLIWYLLSLLGRSMISGEPVKMLLSWGFVLFFGLYIVNLF